MLRESWATPTSAAPSPAHDGAYTLQPLPSTAGSLSARRCGRRCAARVRRSGTNVANPKGRLQPVDLAHELHLEAQLRRVVTKLLPLRLVRVLVELHLRYLARIRLLLLAHAYHQLCLHVGLVCHLLGGASGLLSQQHLRPVAQVASVRNEGHHPTAQFGELDSEHRRVLPHLLVLLLLLPLAPQHRVGLTEDALPPALLELLSLRLHLVHLVVHDGLGLEKLLPDAKRQQAAVEETRHPRMVLLELLYSGYVRHRALQQSHRQRPLVCGL
mmetsp:Transcript_14694/g.36494  ORF Transcript_14694/g.36494 Transcript_14694/m.36494 type:complete len:271 (+) Transcript_14694:172-984(+)